MNHYLYHFDPKEHYAKQLEEIQNYILLNDEPEPEFEIFTPSPLLPVPTMTGIKWLQNSSDKMKGEVVAGSFMSNHFNSHIVNNDIDIYFYSKEHAKAWCDINHILPPKEFVHDLCATVTKSFINYNLIVGVPFENAEDLISKFDIRACAIAYEPLKKRIIAIKGAVGDCMAKRIVFQTQCRSITVRRLVKYIAKGFKTDGYQNAIFVELLRTRSNIDQEILGGYE